MSHEGVDTRRSLARTLLLLSAVMIGGAIFSKGWLIGHDRNWSYRGGLWRGEACDTIGSCQRVAKYGEDGVVIVMIACAAVALMLTVRQARQSVRSDGPILLAGIGMATATWFVSEPSREFAGGIAAPSYSYTLFMLGSLALMIAARVMPMGPPPPPPPPLEAPSEPPPPLDATA